MTDVIYRVKQLLKRKNIQTKYGTGVIICLPISIQLHKKGKTYVCIELKLPTNVRMTL